MSDINILTIILYSKPELYEKLGKSKAITYILGEDSIEQNGYCICRGKTNNNTSIIFDIGAILQGHGAEPTCKIINENFLFLGLNNEIHIINFRDFSQDYKYALESFFYKYVPCDMNDRVIALYYHGVVCVSLEGVELWEYTSRLITNYKVINNTFEFTLDEIITTISISTGKILSKKATSLFR